MVIIRFNRITSYNVCYTKLLRSIDLEGDFDGGNSFIGNANENKLKAYGSSNILSGGSGNDEYIFSYSEIGGNNRIIDSDNT